MFTKQSDHDDASDDPFRTHHSALPGDLDAADGLWDAMDERPGPPPSESGIASRLVVDADTPGAVAALFPDAARLDESREIDVEWLAGDAANAAAVRARRTDAYARLLDVARKRRSRIRPIPETTTAVRVTDGERVREVVSFDVDTLQSDTAHLTVTSHRNRGIAASGALEYTERDAGDRPETATVSVSEGRELAHRDLDVSAVLARTGETDGESDPPRSVVACDCCRVAVGLVRRVGAAAPLTFSRALLGPSEIGRLDALTFVGLVWGVSGATDERLSSRELCRRAAFGLCS